MSISLLLEMAVSADPERVTVVCGDVRWTAGQLSQLARGGAEVIARSSAAHVAYVGVGGEVLPMLMFSAAQSGKAFTPLNYRLSADGISGLLDRLPSPLVVVDEPHFDSLRRPGRNIVRSDEFLSQATEVDGSVEPPGAPADDVAVVLFTSGTTSAPKAVELTHHNLTSYVLGAVDFASADRVDAALVCVPPYHIAGVGAVLSNLYAGRRMVYLPRFDPAEWVHLVDVEQITTATVVPTMLSGIVEVLEAGAPDLWSLATLAYGGAKVAAPLVRRALELLPHTGFVNAYGLTETSSTIALLTPEDHRAALAADAPALRRRLGSVGTPLPGIEIQVRNDHGVAIGTGEVGELFVRGEQVSGTYTGLGSVLDAAGWFPTGDLASVDDDGYLFVIGRSDDTIIRGGENIAPAEIEDVLIEHAGVDEVVVIGLEDDHWGQITVAVVVPAAGADLDSQQLQAHVRSVLRGSRTPDRVVFRQALPTNATGKVLRREVAAEIRATVPN